VSVTITVHRRLEIPPFEEKRHRNFPVSFCVCIGSEFFGYRQQEDADNHNGNKDIGLPGEFFL